MGISFIESTNLVCNPKLVSIKAYVYLGVVDASKTVFLQQDNIIVVTAGLYYCMQVAPKDCYGNPANISQTFLTAEIRKVILLSIYVTDRYQTQYYHSRQNQVDIYLCFYSPAGGLVLRLFLITHIYIVCVHHNSSVHIVLNWRCTSNWNTCSSWSHVNL